MSAFDNVIHEIDERYGLGPKARPLIEETRRVISRHPGGARGFVEMCQAAGFSVEVASWLKGSDPVTLSGEEAEQILGTNSVSQIASKIGVSRCFARTVLGYAIPSVAALRAQSGAIPAAVHASASRLVRAALGGQSAFSKESAMFGKEPKQTLKTHWADAEPVLGGLIIPCVTLLIIFGSLFGYYIGLSDREVNKPPQALAQKEAAAPRPATVSGSPPLSSKSYAFTPTAGNGWDLPQAPLPTLSGNNALSPAGAENVAEPKFPVVYFAPNRASADPASRPLLQKVAQLIKQLPKGTVIEIAGYTDGAGRPIANMKLSQRRANAIRGALIRAGVDPGPLAAKGYGVFHPAAEAGGNGTAEGRSTSLAENRPPNGRRVEISISRSVTSPASLPQ